MSDVGSEILHTNVSWIELVLRPSGANQPLTVSMFMARVTGRVNGGKKIYTLKTGQGVLCKTLMRSAKSRTLATRPR